MDLKVFESRELEMVLRAMRSIAAENGRFTAAERELVEGVAALHGASVDALALEPVAFTDVAEVVTDPHRRRRVVQLAIVAALIEGSPPPETARALGELGRALEIPEEGIDVMFALSRGRGLIARIDMLRRLGRFMRGTAGFPGLLGVALPLVGLASEQPKLAARYHALGQLEPGTLGRALYDHYHDNEFRFPGEPGGIPEFGVFHDIGHVLSGYGTDPHGEIQQAAFQAGFARRDGFTFLLFGILQFHVGIRLTPIAKAERGLFDVSAVLQALERGACCTCDITEGFDLFGQANRPLEAVRTELAIPPLKLSLARPANVPILDP